MKKSLARIAAIFLITLSGAVGSVAQQPAPASRSQQPIQPALDHESCPLHAEHTKAVAGQDHHAALNERGDEAMGFSHLKTTHHFRLSGDGGEIEVIANDAQDEASRNQIRQHMEQVVKQFAVGDFTTPQRVHGKMPPGALVMEKLKARIKYRYEETAQGGRIRIITGNVQALAAIHRFLQFQINDHQTGDSGKVEKLE